MYNLAVYIIQISKKIIIEKDPLFMISNAKEKIDESVNNIVPSQLDNSNNIINLSRLH